MHSGGYLDTRVNNNSPVRMGIVVALHGVALAALMLAPAEMIVKPKWVPIITYNVPDPPPPPPETQADPPKARDQMPEKAPDTLPRFIPPIPNNGQTDTLPQTNTSGGSDEILPPIPVPILSEATMMRGAQVQPDYPSSMARQGIEGVATVRVLIGVDGRVKEVLQISATDPDFFKATQRQALRYWRFKPATRDSVAVESWRQMTVRFKLEA